MSSRDGIAVPSVGLFPCLNNVPSSHTMSIDGVVVVEKMFVFECAECFDSFIFPFLLIYYLELDGSSKHKKHFSIQKLPVVENE